METALRALVGEAHLSCDGLGRSALILPEADQWTEYDDARHAEIDMGANLRVQIPAARYPRGDDELSAGVALPPFRSLIH